jgi:hypothetical protein
LLRRERRVLLTQTCPALRQIVVYGAVVHRRRGGWLLLDGFHLLRFDKKTRLTQPGG